MFTKTILATALTLSLTSVVSAGASHHDDIVEPSGFLYGLQDISKTNTIKKKTYATTAATTASAKTSTVECTANELASLTGDSFVEYVINNAGECVNFLFTGERADVIFSAQNFNNVMQAGVTAAAEYNGTDNLSGLFLYLRSAFYVEFYNPTTVSITSDMKAKAHSMLEAFRNKSDFLSIDTEFHGQLLHDWFGAADGMSDWNTYLDTVTAFISNVTPYRATQYTYMIAYNAASGYIFRGIANGRESFEPALLANPNLPMIMADFSVNPLILDNAEYVASNMANQLGNLFEYPSYVDQVSPAVQVVLNNNDRLSERWMMMVTAIDRFDYVSCDDFDGSVCADDTLRAEIETLVFPNTFVFDDMVFHTSLSRDEIEQIFYQLKEVEGAFFRTTGATEPVAGDVNDVAIFRIYGSRAEYSSFQPFLYGLPANNGGIYMEGDATLYTWDRESHESMFTLEELARHEYVHYLVSRYMIPGLWGRTEMYADQRVTWLDEGMANFLAGGTQYDGLSPLPSMVEWIAGNTEHYTPHRIVNLTYSDQLMYPYSALLFNYLHNTETNDLKDLVSVLRNDDVAGYDMLRTRIGETSSTGFDNYLTGLIANRGNLNTPWKQYSPENTLWFTSASDVQDELTTDFSSLVNNVSCIDADDVLYSCTMIVNYTVSDADNELYEMAVVIDDVVSNLVTSANLNLSTVNCYATEIGIVEHTITCEGGLRRSTTAIDAPNNAPTTQDSSYEVKANETVSGQMIGEDLDNDALDYVIVSGNSDNITFNSATGEFEFAADAQFQQATFTFYVTDGIEQSNVSRITVTVIEEEEPIVVPVPNIAPTANNMSMTVEVNKTATGTLTGSDQDGDSLTFRMIDQPTAGSMTLDGATGQFTYNASNTAGTVTFTYVTNDGEVDSTPATVTVTVTVAPNTSTPPSTPSTPSAPTASSTGSESGGGSFGIFSALLLGVVALVRRKQK